MQPTLQTTQRLILGDARDLGAIGDGTTDLVVTSPPYPLVGMWDPTWGAWDPAIVELLELGRGAEAFDRIHAELDRVWRTLLRVLVPGGFACINIGDAVRTFDGVFGLWPNHARTLQGARAAGFEILPDVLWRKATNAPNKFMGSGMLPAGAYVTYEHEYVLVLRRPGRQDFKRPERRACRRASAFFWEERNIWFSDVWSGITGSRQDGLDAALRNRTGAFPLEIPFRLVQMYSCIGDTVLDPFAGTGTTLLAALASARNGVGVENDASLWPTVAGRLETGLDTARARVARRLADHATFVGTCGRTFRHRNGPHDTPVATRQEADLELLTPSAIRAEGDGIWRADHERATATLRTEARRTGTQESC
jgi:DNA modification methylase